MSEIDDLETYATPDARISDAVQARRVRAGIRAKKDWNERQRMRAAAARKRDQEIFDRLGLPKGKP